MRDTITTTCPNCLFPLLTKVDIDYCPRVVTQNCPSCKSKIQSQYQLVLLKKHPVLIHSNEVVTL